LGISLQQLISFILLPIYTRYLTVSDYGVLRLILITGQIVRIVFTLGLISALFRSYYDYNEEKNRRIVISTTFFLIIVDCCILFVFGLFSSKHLSMLLFDDTKYEIYFLIIILTTMFRILNNMPFTIFQAQKKSITYISFRISFFITGIILIIYFVVVGNYGIWGVLVGNLITAIVSFLVLYFYIKEDIVLKFSKLEAQKMIKYGAPLVLAGLSGFVFTYMDRYMLNYYLTLREVGLYTLGYQFGMLMYILLISPSKLILSPMFLSAKDDSNAKDFYSRTLTYTIFIGLFLFLVLALLSKEVIQIFSNKEYWNAYKVIPIITLAYLVWATRSITEIGISLKRKTKVTAWYFFIGATTNIILNMVWIPKYGIIGATYATFIAFSIMSIISYYYGSIRYIKINYEWIRILKMSLVTALIFAAGFFVRINDLYTSIAFKFSIILSYLLILYLLQFYTTGEIKGIKQIFGYVFVRLKLRISK
jgi:O-antigen/teichoic acid export membrane protein